MPEIQQRTQFNRAVLVGLNARSLSDEENADDATLEELSALLETAGGETAAVDRKSVV